ncbi:hypothetical protein ARMGADRAFT_827743 [Armillaria gallica]|uniref:Uncharacterized protein n=1 Tax=Armillaria gallica TaxID=47427 RepID=A0A2H3CQE7_ARMGA|nr:hypothetical protein ARMGADRAFT_827743 [Armillaria gallica]
MGLETLPFDSYSMWRTCYPLTTMRLAHARRFGINAISGYTLSVWMGQSFAGIFQCVSLFFFLSCHISCIVSCLYGNTLPTIWTTTRAYASRRKGGLRCRCKRNGRHPSCKKSSKSRGRARRRVSRWLSCSATPISHNLLSSSHNSNGTTSNLFKQTVRWPSSYITDERRAMKSLSLADGLAQVKVPISV